MPPPPPRSHQNAQFYVQRSSGFCWIPPCSAASFEVNSEPHTGARPSVRLCVELITIKEFIKFDSRAFFVHPIDLVLLHLMRRTCD
jgi:hypothetical protein